MYWNDKNKQYELALVTGYNPSTSYFTLGNPTVNENIPSYKGKCKKLHLLTKHATSKLKVPIGGTWVTSAFKAPDFVPPPEARPGPGGASATAHTPRRRSRSDSTAPT